MDRHLYVRTWIEYYRPKLIAEGEEKVRWSMAAGRESAAWQYYRGRTSREDYKAQMAGLDEVEEKLGLRSANEAATPLVPENPFENEKVLRTCYHQPPFERTVLKLSPEMDQWYNPCHWAVAILRDSLCDLEALTDEVVAEWGVPDNVDPYLVFGAFASDMPGHLPHWFPKAYEDRALSSPEMLAWFDKLLKHYADEWPMSRKPDKRQHQLVHSLLEIYAALMNYELPRPSWLKEKE